LVTKWNHETKKHNGNGERGNGVEIPSQFFKECRDYLGLPALPDLLEQW
jgi:hypothetical protein